MSIVKRKLRTLMRGVGHRGAFLLLISTAFILYGIGLHYEPANYHHTDFYLAFGWWPWVFITSGLVVLCTVPLRCRSRKFKPQIGAVGFGLAAAISFWWSFRWFHVWIAENGAAGWTTSFAWAFISLAILLVASWPEHHHHDLE